MVVLVLVFFLAVREAVVLVARAGLISADGEDAAAFIRRDRNMEHPEA